MPQDSPIYDLTLLLSTSVEDQDRAKILSDVESAIAAGGGSVERKDDWGVRPMSYRIRHQTDADYYLLQFSGPPALLDSLSHSLRIADEVLRFRIIKVIPGMPPAPESPPPVVAAVAHGGGAVERDGGGGGGEREGGSGAGEREAGGAGEREVGDGAEAPEA